MKKMNERDFRPDEDERSNTEKKKINWPRINWRLAIWLSVPLFFLMIEAGLLAGSGMAQLFSKVIAVFFFVAWMWALGVMFLDDRFSAGNVLGIIILLGEIAVFLWMTAPWYHSIAMCFYINPEILEILVISIIAPVILGVIYKLVTKNGFSEDAIMGMIITFFAILIVGGGLFGIMAHAYSRCEIANSLEVTEIQKLPNMDINYTRIMPRMVANRFAVDACQYPQYTPQPPDIAILNKTMFWSYVLVPDGLVNTYNLKDRGVVFVNITTDEKDLTVKERYLKIGPRMKVTDDVYWKIYQKHYWIETEKTNAILYEGHVYQVIPYIKYEMHFHFPIWYKVPRWGGVILVNETGDIQFLNTREAQNSPVLKGQKLFPESLVRYYVDAQRYWMAKRSFWSGTWNVWIHHEKELEITDVSSQGNRQPFLIKTAEKLEWLISTEPYGSAHGIYRVYLIDARTGKIEYKEFSGKEIGPVRASDYVKKSNPIFDWSTFRPIEPIPVINNGTLFWEVRVVPKDGSGIAKIAFVDSESGKVIMFQRAKEITSFLLNGTYQTEEKKSRISGRVIDIDSFEQQGNTRWIVTIENDSITINFLAKAEELNFTEINILTDLQNGERVTIEYQGYQEDVVNTIEKIRIS